MGCDIHLYREKKINGVWQTADVWVEDDGDTYIPHKERGYSGRNYDLFGFLAKGVRREFDNSFEQRGFPDDASEAVRKTSEDWGSDGHSHSWLGLNELKAAYERLQTETIPISGLMDKEQLAGLQATIDAGAPDWNLLYPYCQGSSSSSDVRFEVQVPADFGFGYALKEIIESFDSIDGDEHRIVFFFDN